MEAIQSGGTSEDDASAEPPEAATGDRDVDDVLTGLAALEDTPVSGHVAILEDAQTRLSDILAGIDEPSGTSPA